MFRLAIGGARIGRETSTVRMRVHAADERYYGRAAGELVPLIHPEGIATYVHAQPCVLAPAITLSIDLSPIPTDAGAIGEVGGSDWEGMRHRDIGTAQAWWYPADRVVVLWECVLDDAVRPPGPRAAGDEPAADARTSDGPAFPRRAVARNRRAMTPGQDLRISR